MKKRGSLSLSVNAIVVFILAFSMLGVGLFFINKMRTQFDVNTDDVFDINEFKNPPTSDRPLVVPETVKVKAGEKLKLDIGLYARSVTVTDAQFRITSCDKGGVDGAVQEESLPTLTSPGGAIEQGQGMGFKVLLTVPKEGMTNGETYVCKLEAYNGATTTPAIESASFYIEMKQ